jgi:hypothetical protein
VLFRYISVVKGEHDGSRGWCMIEMLKRMIIISIYRLTIMSFSFSFEKKNASQYSYM